MSLPFDIAGPISGNPRSLLLYGAPKVGKTKVLTNLPNCCIVQVESGADMHECIRTPQITSYAHFMQVCDQIIKAGKPYKYVAFDTVDAMEDYALTQATIDYKMSPIGANFKGADVTAELANGGGYLWLRRALNRMIDKAFETIPPDGCVIFIGHIKEKLLSKEGKDVTASDISLTGKCAVILCSRCDAIGHVTRALRPGSTSRVEDLKVSFRTTELVNCGSRYDHLAGQDFVLSPGDTKLAAWDKIFKPVQGGTGSAV